MGFTRPYHVSWSYLASSHHGYPSSFTDPCRDLWWTKQNWVWYFSPNASGNPCQYHPITAPYSFASTPEQTVQVGESSGSRKELDTNVPCSFTGGDPYGLYCSYVRLRQELVFVSRILKNSKHNWCRVLFSPFCIFYIYYYLLLLLFFIVYFVYRTNLYMCCWPCIITYQYSETNVMYFLFNLLRIKSLYVFRVLLVHPQEALYKRHLVYRVRVMSVGCFQDWSGAIASLQSW
jgi:hypothetical protein